MPTITPPPACPKISKCRGGAPKILTGLFPIEPLEPRIALAVNIVSGVIPDGSIWADGDIQHITGDAQLLAGTTLTIQPGAIIQFGFADLTIAGTLNAQGTAGNKILFTSVDDDSGRDGIAGSGDDIDTGLNGPTTGSAGNWGQIHFTSTSTSNQLTHAEIRYGGNFETVLAEGPLTMSNTTIKNSLNVGLKVLNTTATLTNNTFTTSSTNGLVLDTAGSSTVGDNTFSNNTAAGIRIINSTPTLTNNTWSGNAGNAISMDLVSTPVITGSSFSNNGLNGLRLDNGTLSGSNSWNNPDVVYVLNGTIVVPAGATLTVGVGQVIKASTNTGDQLQVDGTIIADGTDDEPIIFTSL